MPRKKPTISIGGKLPTDASKVLFSTSVRPNMEWTEDGEQRGFCSEKSYRQVDKIDFHGDNVTIRGIDAQGEQVVEEVKIQRVVTAGEAALRALGEEVRQAVKEESDD